MGPQVPRTSDGPGPLSRRSQGGGLGHLPQCRRHSIYGVLAFAHASHGAKENLMHRVYARSSSAEPFLPITSGQKREIIRVLWIDRLAKKLQLKHGMRKFVLK
ncbi:hypothetical protein AVEN_115726-1 [Araneus ventricosus]|uniref:Uncharacterized protein n=1 Tax=Araneus ventricosus TaxID=182803 RepID=A0A4Y2VIA5_ARAVE|nr:hypothetical protein AVEN_115726-1 [Araneus ventricosus]